MGRAVIFDLDGTLWDSSRQVTESWNRTFRRLGLGKRLTTADMRALMGKTMDEIGLAVFPERDEGFRRETMDLCCREENDYLLHHGARLYPGLRMTLSALAAAHGLYIVSNCQDGYIQAFLAAHRLGPLFRDLECFGRTGRVKADSIRILMARCGLADAVYVGDTAGDEAAARGAGIGFIHASYGFGRAEAPDAVLRRFTELPNVLDTI